MVGLSDKLKDSVSANKLLILLTAITWGSSFFMLKGVVEELPVMFTLAVRFSASFVLCSLLFRSRAASHFDRRTILFGAAIGVLNIGAYAVQTIGLTLTTPGKNAFLTGVYSVLTPFVAWLIGMGAPKARNVIGAVVCVCGAWLVVAGGEGSLNLGDLLTLFGGVLYAIQYAIIARFGTDIDIFAATVWELLVMGLLAAGASVLFEQAPDLSSISLQDGLSLAYLVLVCSCFNFVALNYAITKVPPADAALLSSLEAPFGTAFSVLLYGEQLTPRLTLGFTLIFLSVVYSEAGPTLVDRVKRTLAASAG